MSEHIAYMNGEYVPVSECKVHVFDSGFRLGDAVYDVERTFDGKIFRLRDHLERLFRSLKFIRLDPGLTMEQFEEISNEVVARNEPMRKEVADYRVLQMVSRGGGYDLQGDSSPTVCVTVAPISFENWAREYESPGGHVVFPKTRTFSTMSLDPKVKHYSRLNFVLAEMEAQDVDPSAHPVLLDEKGNIAEGTTNTLFLVTKGVLNTPGDSGTLQGITEDVVLELARRLQIPTSEEEVQPYDAYTADEAFLASTSLCILPIGRFDNRPTNLPAPGPITKQLMAAFSEMVDMDFVSQALEFTRRRS